MRLRDLEGWASDSKCSPEAVDQRTLPCEGRLKGCWYIHGGRLNSDYLTLVIECEDRVHFGVINGYPEPMLRRIYATLRNHEGGSIAQLADLELVDQPDAWQLSF